MLLSQPSYFNLLQRYIRPFAGQFVLLAVILLGSIAMQLAAPQALRIFLDATQMANAEGPVLAAALLFIGLSVVQRILALSTTYTSENLGWQATNRLRIDLTAHALRLDLDFHKRYTAGELIERIDGDCDLLGNFFSQFSLRIISNALLSIGILLLLFREDWRLGVGLSIYAALTLAALFAVQQISVKRWAAKREADTALQSFVEERMAATEDLRANGAEQYALQQLTQLAERMLNTRRSAELANNLGFASTNLLFLIGYAIGLAVGALLYFNGSVTIGTAFLIVYYIGMLSDPLETIRSQMQDLQQASASIGRIMALLAEQPRMQVVAEQRQPLLPTGALAVQLEQVQFSYSDSEATEPQLVLQDISFCLDAGQILGLLGRTGSGKTTLARLVARLYDVSAGQIRLGGIDLQAFPLSELRGRVGVVTQDVQIFQASIRENLTLFRTGMSDQQIEAALNELELLEWLRGLPDGLDTMLGPGGLGLSAGEAQLLAFARVFLQNPGLIILDEASSRLDPATERLLERAIRRLLAGRTAIIIAHRLGTIQRADQVLILEQGRIAEYGTRTALLSDQESRLAELLRVGMEEILV